MEPGQVIKGHSSLKLEVVPELEDKDILQIVGLSTNPEHQRMGHATELLKEVCRRADMSMFMLLLVPEPFGKRVLDASQLERWYGKFGFETIQKKPILMAREPRTMVYDIEKDSVVEGKAVLQ